VDRVQTGAAGRRGGLDEEVELDVAGDRLGGGGLGDDPGSVDAAAGGSQHSFSDRLRTGADEAEAEGGVTLELGEGLDERGRRRSARLGPRGLGFRLDAGRGLLRRRLRRRRRGTPENGEDEEQCGAAYHALTLIGF
jgi:hypothetical protein